MLSRSKQRYLEIRLVRGSITEVDAGAYVLGVFQGVDPVGPAETVDRLMGGAIREFALRRMFSARAGEVFVVPAGRHLIHADMVLLSGLGSVDEFDDEVQRLAAENVARTLIRTCVDNFATVLVGAGSTLEPARAVENLLRGYLHALREADGDQVVRRITFCEIDAPRYAAMRAEVLRLADTELFQEYQVFWDERRFPPGRTPAAGSRKSRSRSRAGTGPATDVRPPVMYLVVREEATETRGVALAAGASAGGSTAARASAAGPAAGQASADAPAAARASAGAPAAAGSSARAAAATGRSSTDGDTQWSVAVLTPSGRAALLSGRIRFQRSVLDRLLARLDSSSLSMKSVESLGDELGRLLLPANVLEMLPRSKDAHLVVVHDAPCARIPWEVLRIDGWFPAAEAGTTRRYAADDLSMAKWAETRRQAPGIRILLIVNPTGDLPGASEEGRHLEKAFSGNKSIVLEKLTGSEATFAAVREVFHSGRYDVVHYAGHALFNPDQPSESGVLCADNRVLRGADLADLSNLPALVFFNACESGRVRRAGRAGAAANSDRIRALIDANVGLAEAFMRGGVANYLGTYWPVGDASATSFAETFYASLLKKEGIGTALQAARRVLREELRSMDWADYMFYGTPDFPLKLG